MCIIGNIKPENQDLLGLKRRNRELEEENARKKTRPRTVDLYEAFCGVLHLLTTGCQWRNLPSDFPHWKTVYAYYQIWRKVDENDTSLLEKVHKKMVETYREQDGREKYMDSW
ncbi:transposase [Bacillus sp. B-TM1]